MSEKLVNLAERLADGVSRRKFLDRLGFPLATAVGAFLTQGVALGGGGKKCCLVGNALGCSTAVCVRKNDPCPTTCPSFCAPPCSVLFSYFLNKCEHCA